MKTIEKKYWKIMPISHIGLFIVAVFISVVPFTLKAQSEKYYSSDYVLVGTSDSRFFITLNDTDEYLELQVSFIGEMSARAMFFDFLYNPATLILTNKDLTFEAPDATINTFPEQIVYKSAIFEAKYPGYTTRSRRHRAVFEGSAAHMKYFVTEVEDGNPYANLLYLAPGEALHAFSIYLKKRNPGVPIQQSDFGYFAQSPNSNGDALQTSLWLNSAFSIAFAAMSPLDFHIVKPNFYSFRSPSSVIAGEPVLTDTKATINATLTRGNLKPSHEILVSSYREAANYGRLDWDSITHYGFLYSNVNATIQVKGFSNKLNIDGVDYNFPDAGELAAGKFVRNGKTFFISMYNNNLPDQSISFDQEINLAQNKNYYAWPFFRFTYETSNSFLTVGNKVMFNTVEVLECTFMEDQTVDEDDPKAGYYTHTGSEWDAIQTQGIIVVDAYYQIMISGTLYTGTTLHGFQFPLGNTTVKWFGEDDHGNIDSCEFMVTVNDVLCPETIDFEGGPYKVIPLAGLCWTTNMATRNYANGISIPFARAYNCKICPDSTQNATIFGLLYTWYSAVGVPEGSTELPVTNSDGFVQGICPDGWHVPTHNELKMLNQVPVEDLKSIDYWLIPGGTNATGFDARPAGKYSKTKNRFEELYAFAGYWSANIKSDLLAHYYSIAYYCNLTELSNIRKSDGLNVRCVWDY